MACFNRDVVYPVLLNSSSDNGNSFALFVPAFYDPRYSPLIILFLTRSVHGGNIRLRWSYKRWNVNRQKENRLPFVNK
jgi:hypothetical protein